MGNGFVKRICYAGIKACTETTDLVYEEVYEVRLDKHAWMSRWPRNGSRIHTWGDVSKDYLRLVIRKGVIRTSHVRLMRKRSGTDNVKTSKWNSNHSSHWIRTYKVKPFFLLINCCFQLHNIFHLNTFFLFLPNTNSITSFSLLTFGLQDHPLQIFHLHHLSVHHPISSLVTQNISLKGVWENSRHGHSYLVFLIYP